MASDSDSDEDFVTYGTPLEPLEEDEGPRKPVPLHEQTVRDEKGRYKRFHGAFTGGFSAGYFNTVGTKEGWTPSTFVSSRQQKAQQQNSRPEDFMDEEDLNEHGIAPRAITTTDEFRSKHTDPIREKARAISSLSGPIPGDTLLEELIAPSKSSIGVQLLRKMGWREGQGVGPRVRKRKQRRDEAVSGSKVYGCALPAQGSEESEDSDDEFAPADVTFAPKDVCPMTFDPKENVHGLGYRGLNPHQALLGGSAMGHIDLFSPHSERASNLFGHTAHRSHAVRGVAGQAFGGDDEEDGVYHKDSMANYDSVLGGEEPGDGLYGWTAPQQYKKLNQNPQRDAIQMGKIIQGFTQASIREEPRKVFPPPLLPRDYRPVHYFRPSPNMAGVTASVAAVLQDSKGQLPKPSQETGRHQLDSTQRRELLGETALHGPSSVFELLRPEDKQRLDCMRQTIQEQQKTPRAGIPDLSSVTDRAAVVASAKATALQALSSRFQNSQTGGSAPVQSHQQGGQETLALAAWSAQTADPTKTFKPFDKNPSKQARYEHYLTLMKQGQKDALERSLDVCMTEWERGREREEFVRAALLYKPSSSVLSSRFTRSKQDNDDDSTVEVARDQENDVNDKQSAVKMKMFGKLTRDTFEWHPDKVLCKRFNVPNPYPGSGIVGMPKVKRDRFSVFNFLSVNENPPASSQPPAPPQVPPSGSSEADKRSSRWDVASATSAPTSQTDPLTQLISEARSSASSQKGCNEKASGNQAKVEEKNNTKQEEEEGGEKVQDGDEEEEEEEKRPSMDLFKAIFSSSDKSSSSSEDEQSEEDLPDSHPLAVEPGLSSALPLNTKAEVTPAPVPPPQPIPTEDISAPSGDKEEDAFGPRLPPPTTIPIPVEEEAERVRKKSKQSKKSKKDHKHKKSKKHKKQKKSKHKSKERKKKETRREPDSSSSDSDSSDIEVVSTEDVLRRLKNVGRRL